MLSIKCVFKGAAAAAIGVMALSVMPDRAAAAISIGTDDPAEVAFKLGAFDSVNGRQPAALMGAEYRFGQTFFHFRPFIGGTLTTEIAAYGYAGLGFDVAFGRHWVLTPNAAFGFYGRGTGTNLGSTVEFRTGAELDYRFDREGRLGITFHHDSNAGLSHRNPGEEEIGIVYALPLSRLMP